MSYRSKAEYLTAIRERYRHAGRVGKQAILEEFCPMCGYHRKCAIRLLRQKTSHVGPVRPLHVVAG